MRTIPSLTKRKGKARWWLSLFHFAVRVPQTLGEAMNVENAEANYENTFENLYGMSSYDNCKT